MTTPINFADQSSQIRSDSQNRQRLINMYAEASPEDSKYPYTLINTAGLELFADIGSGAIRGMEVMGNELYVVSGDNVYKVSTSSAASDLGSIGTVSGAVVMANNGTDVVIVKDSGDAWLADTSSLTQVSDGDYVSSSSVTVLDGYGIFTRTWPLSSLTSTGFTGATCPIFFLLVSSAFHLAVSLSEKG